MLEVFRWWQKAGRMIEIVNPTCEDGPDKDALTDRWPASLHEQNLFVRDLEDFAA